MKSAEDNVDKKGLGEDNTAESEQAMVGEGEPVTDEAQTAEMDQGTDEQLADGMNNKKIIAGEGDVEEAVTEPLADEKTGGKNEELSKTQTEEESIPEEQKDAPPTDEGGSWGKDSTAGAAADAPSDGESKEEPMTEQGNEGAQPTNGEWATADDSRQADGEQGETNAVGMDEAPQPTASTKQVEPTATANGES